MFESQRYITKGVQVSIPTEIQGLLWYLVDDLKSQGIEQDYLQVFRLESGPKGLKIIHIQEVPPYQKEHLVEVNCQLKEKIFVIDSEDYCTMLLAHEY